MPRKNSTAIHKGGGWQSGLVEWTDRNATCLSVVFSWQLGKAIARVVELSAQGRCVYIGGPAARYAGCEVGDYLHAHRRHNPRAVFTTTGCPLSCPFCIVPKTEGDLVELPDEAWDPVPDAIVCDNNLTACSRRHFDGVIDRLKASRRIDLQGVDVRLLTSYHASRLAELDLKVVHIAWDDIRHESIFFHGLATLLAAGIPKSKIMAYVLIGFEDSPDDALYRLETIRRLGIWPFPMRYQPLDTLKRNAFVGKNWTHKELVRYCRYWANLRITSRIPFADFRYGSQ